LEDKIGSHKKVSDLPGRGALWGREKKPAGRAKGGPMREKKLGKSKGGNIMATGFKQKHKKRSNLVFEK